MVKAAVAQEAPEEVIVVSPTTKRARIKGTWTQFYGGNKWDFVDQSVYELPTDLYEYLKQHGCIYDVLI